VAIPVSTAPQVVQAILADIAAVVAADSNAGAMTVCLGTPGPNVEDEVVYIPGEVNRVSTFQSFTGGFGAGTLRESYDFDVHVSVYSNEDGATCMNRAWVIAAYVETAIRNDPTVGGLVEVCYPSGTRGGEPAPIQEPAGVQTDIVITVHAETTL